MEKSGKSSNLKFALSQNSKNWQRRFFHWRLHVLKNRYGLNTQLYNFGGSPIGKYLAKHFVYVTHLFIYMYHCMCKQLRLGDSFISFVFLSRISISRLPENWWFDFFVKNISIGCCNYEIRSTCHCYYCYDIAKAFIPFIVQRQSCIVFYLKEGNTYGWSSHSWSHWLQESRVGKVDQEFKVNIWNECFIRWHYTDYGITF